LLAGVLPRHYHLEQDKAVDDGLPGAVQANARRGAAQILEDFVAGDDGPAAVVEQAEGSGRNRRRERRRGRFRGQAQQGKRFGLRPTLRARQWRAGAAFAGTLPEVTA
jgi:hypothetical protein